MRKHEITYGNTKYLQKLRKFLGAYMAFNISDGVEGEVISYKERHQLAIAGAYT